jgi:hypothetical protein
MMTTAPQSEAINQEDIAATKSKSISPEEEANAEAEEDMEPFEIVNNSTFETVGEESSSTQTQPQEAENIIT